MASRALKTVRWTVFTRRDVGRRARSVQIRPMFSHRRLLQIKRCNPLRGCILVGPAGFEPTQWRSQSPLPYRLATAQQKKRPRSIITVRSLVGCLERFELSASRATIWRANQLRHRHHIMRPKGLEPPAHCLEGSCSIQLSYGRIAVLALSTGHAAYDIIAIRGAFVNNFFQFFSDIYFRPSYFSCNGISKVQVVPVASVTMAR